MPSGDNAEPTDHGAAPASSSSPAMRAKGRSRSHPYLLTFALALLFVWTVGTFACVYFYPKYVYDTVERSIVDHGVGGSGSPGIPINTIYTIPTLASPSQSASLASTGNRDTLYTTGWLDLSKGPEVLHVPDMAGRYYAVQFVDTWGTDFAYVGRRTTGTQAGDYLITGPGWRGEVPAGMKQIVAPENSVWLIGRTLVESDGDLATAYGLAKQIEVTPLSQGQPSH